MPGPAARAFLMGFPLLMLGACGGSQQSLNLSMSLRTGEVAPRVHTKTLAYVGGDVSRITTYRQPDERMYEYSVDQALALAAHRSQAVARLLRRLDHIAAIELSMSGRLLGCICRGRLCGTGLSLRRLCWRCLGRRILRSGRGG